MHSIPSTSLAHGTTTVLPFRDRSDAGRRLAGRLEAFREDEVVVLGIPRGGVIVAAQIARALNAPLDVLVVRKILSPWNPGEALGAVTPEFVLQDAGETQSAGVSPRFLALGIERAASEVRGRDALYHARRLPTPLEGKTVILVDDGIATGSTAAAAVASVRSHLPAQLVLAVPVASDAGILRVEPLVDRMVCLDVPTPFHSVREWYERFEAVTDDEVLRTLAHATVVVSVRES